MRIIFSIILFLNEIMYVDTDLGLSYSMKPDQIICTCKSMQVIIVAYKNIIIATDFNAYIKFYYNSVNIITHFVPTCDFVNRIVYMLTTLNFIMYTQDL